jgi:transposase
MRKNINGLSAIVGSLFKLDPFGGALFAFCNGNRTILKILEWDGDGFWLHQKRLERGRFKWPEAETKEETMALDDTELNYLLGSPGLEQKLRRKQISEKMAV